MSDSRKEIYTYRAPWPIYAIAWSNRSSSKYRLAVCSYIEKYNNQVNIIEKDSNAGDASAVSGKDVSSESSDFQTACTFDHPYPCTKVMFSPWSESQPEILATTGDYLRIWNVNESTSGLAVKKIALLNNNKNSEYCAPLTSFDWNDVDHNMIGTCSIDSTCTIWDIETKTAKTQLIAHDKEVFDISFSRSKDVFASVGADGSVRMFDLRSLEHSTIIYESPKLSPLLRLSWNKCDPNYLATFMVDSNRTAIIDIRYPSVTVASLGGHMANVNALAWAPHSSAHICTVGEDWQALIWELSKVSHGPIDDPILAYNAEGEINNILWSRSQPDWVSIAFKDKLQMLRV